MEDGYKLAHAKKVFTALTTSLDRKAWPYQKHEDELMVTFAVQGEDLPIHFIINIDADRQLLRVLSPLPITVPEAKRMDTAMAAGEASFRLPDGNFDFGIGDGRITFRMTASFKESEISDSLFDYLIDYPKSIICEYNDKFLALSKGLISVDDFIQQM